MKLKTLVGSLMMLGVVSTSVYAAPKTSQAQNSNNAQINNLTQRIQKLEATINRNQDNAANDPSALLNPNWFQNIIISGEFEPTISFTNRDFQYGQIHGYRENVSGNSNAFIRNSSSTQAYLNVAELYLDAQVNNFTDLHAALDYDYDPSVYGSTTSGEQPTATTPGQTMFFSEANVRFSNLANSGFYSVLGKQFFNFGSYQHDTLSTPFTEMLTKTNNIGSTIGYVSNMGFNVDAFAFGGYLNKRTTLAQTKSDANIDSPSINTWGTSTGYTMQNQKFGMNFHLDFLSNMAQTIYVSHAMVTTPGYSNTYYNTIPAISAHLGLTSGPFGLAFDYVTALKRFATTDLQTAYPDAYAPLGAKPNATNSQLNYNFNVGSHANTTYAGYQTSHDAQHIFSQDLGGYYMPQSRVDVGDKFTIGQNVLLNVEIDHDNDYDKDDDYSSGSGRSSNGIVAGVDVKF